MAQFLLRTRVILLGISVLVLAGCPEKTPPAPPTTIVQLLVGG